MVKGRLGPRWAETSTGNSLQPPKETVLGASDTTTHPVHLADAFRICYPSSTHLYKFKCK